ncbi:MAG: hypothetical protein AAF533_08715 [Acidobacteriota bacterium]
MNVSLAERILLTHLHERCPEAAAAGLGVDDSLLAGGVLSSLQVLELLLEVEKLVGRPLEPADLDPAVFSSLGHLCRHFFTAAVS